MSYADQVFIANIKNILENGVSSEGMNVRPRWEDGTPAHTISVFGVVNRYDLSKEFPIITLRRSYWKTAWDEIAWIWQKKSNNINDLGSHVWDQWADETGSIGKAYGYQMAKKYPFPEGMSDQVDHVIWQLQNDPASRRIMTNMYNFEDLHEMALAPCAYSMTFSVKGNKLNAILNQRSQDMIAANNFNVVEYAMIVYALASAYGFEPGELVHCVADMHIYDRHIEMARELIQNPTYDAPKFWIDPNVKNFYDFTKDSFRLDGYQYSEFNHKIPIAV
ncbi:MAG: thymidylate synthase [Ruminococcaceae bacterium]|nr:thymidylate synthase [Oscillospiraceae bacterium]